MPVADYSYIADQELADLAKTEVGEDAKKTKAHIEGLRRWLKSQEHLSCVDDDETLLRFLRTHRFDQMKAQEMLEAFCIVRGSEEGAKDWFSYPKDIKPILNMLEEGFMVPLGLNEKREVVILFRSGLWDTSKVDFLTMIQSMCLAFDILGLNPLLQVAGFVALVDFENFSQDHVSAWSNESVAKLMLMQKAMPLRIKEVHYYHTSIIVDGIFQLFQLFMDPNVMKMVKWHKNDSDALKAAIGEDILPQEYGGLHGSLSKLSDTWVKEVESKFGELERISNSVRVDTSKKPAQDMSLLKEYVSKLNEARQS